MSLMTADKEKQGRIQLARISSETQSRGITRSEVAGREACVHRQRFMRLTYE